MPAIPLPPDAPDFPSPIVIPDLDAIATGTTANDGTGDASRTAFTKVNDNYGLLLGTIQKCAPQAWEVPGIQTADYDATVGSYCIRMNATSGAKNVNLPAAADVEGHAIEVVKTDASANSVFLVADGTDTLDMATGAEELTSQWESIRVRSVGTGWVKV